MVGLMRQMELGVCATKSKADLRTVHVGLRGSGVAHGRRKLVTAQRLAALGTCTSEHHIMENSEALPANRDSS